MRYARCETCDERHGTCVTATCNVCSEKFNFECEVARLWYTRVRVFGVMSLLHACIFARALAGSSMGSCSSAFNLESTFG